MKIPFTIAFLFVFFGGGQFSFTVIKSSINTESIPTDVLNSNERVLFRNPKILYKRIGPGLAKGFSYRIKVTRLSLDVSVRFRNSTYQYDIVWAKTLKQTFNSDLGNQ